VNKPPAFQFYARDWRSSPTVRLMSHKERGVYIELLAAAWDQEEPGTLPLPIEFVSKCAGLDPRLVRNFLKKFPTSFREIGGKLVNTKLNNQWLELEQLREKKSDAGKKGNEARWGQGSQVGSQTDRPASATAPSSALVGSSVGNQEEPPAQVCSKPSLHDADCNCERLEHPPVPKEEIILSPDQERLLTCFKSLLPSAPDRASWPVTSLEVLALGVPVEILCEVAQAANQDYFWTKEMTSMKRFLKLLKSESDKCLLAWFHSTERQRKIKACMSQSVSAPDPNPNGTLPGGKPKAVAPKARF